MGLATLKPETVSRTGRPRLLIVDDEPDVLSLLRDALVPRIDCTVSTAATLAEARQRLADESVDLLLTDLKLPDGDGLSLVPELREKHPAAGAMVITGNPSVQGAVEALRAGAVDFVTKPFSIDQIADRVLCAIRRQALTARNDRRLSRLKEAVRRLNRSRKLVSRKVDLLCNDLISAYGDVARQVEDLRNQESFRRLLESSRDLEQMLCHAMDWILRGAGYCNLAVWLAADDSEYQLGAYMKYTIAGEPALTESLKRNLVPMTAREGLVHLEGYDVRKYLSPAEFKYLQGQTVLSINCTYLGESLAVLVLFRDEKSPFTEEVMAMLRAIAPVFATALAGMVRKHDAEDEYGDGGGLAFDDDPGSPPDDPKQRDARKKKEIHDADWWKRGDPPPF
ncbi:MAG: response regulator [Phycisphaerae bacterium]|nr:response regulator [Phycisphaerae bacterium]MDW8262057.1 response regulator [Phycisphaerales bacterium]